MRRRQGCGREPTVNVVKGQLAACRSQVAGRRSQLAVSCDETPCRKQCSSRARPVFACVRLCCPGAGRERARASSEIACSAWQCEMHTQVGTPMPVPVPTHSSVRRDRTGPARPATKPSPSQSKARRQRRRATVTKMQSSNNLEQLVAANRRAARIRARRGTCGVPWHPPRRDWAPR